MTAMGPSQHLQLSVFILLPGAVINPNQHAPNEIINSPPGIIFVFLVAGLGSGVKVIDLPRLFTKRVLLALNPSLLSRQNKSFLLHLLYVTLPNVNQIAVKVNV